MEIVDWTPPDWACNCFPQTEVGQLEVCLTDLIAVAQAHLDTVTEADTTARGAIGHVAHILVTLQGADGLWPERLNLRTGRSLSPARSAAPLTLFRRLNAMLDSTEFDPACRCAEAAVAAHTAPSC
jgi:hypothetical protein